jgi:hypothetical protein
MNISPTTRVSVPSDILFRELDGESVILNLGTGCYFGLQEVGTRMWAALTASESIQAAYEILLAEYEVDAEQLRRDLEELVGKLVEHGLVQVSGG